MAGGGGEETHTRYLVGKPRREKSLKRSIREEFINFNLKETGRDTVHLTGLSHCRITSRTAANLVLKQQ
jgi:hypothetical protein